MIELLLLVIGVCGYSLAIGYSLGYERGCAVRDARFVKSIEDYLTNKQKIEKRFGNTVERTVPTQPNPKPPTPPERPNGIGNNHPPKQAPVRPKPSPATYEDE